MSPRSILGFDTSGINALSKDGTVGEHLLAGLSAGYSIRLNATALDEIIAHGTAKEREQLRSLCRRLLANGEGDILLPFHEIVTRLARAFETHVSFDWTRIDVRSPEYLQFVFGAPIPDLEVISSEQRASHMQTGGQFENVFFGPRPVFQKLREDAQSEPWPKSAAQLAQVLQAPGGAYWNYAIGLYQRASGQNATEEKIKAFLDACPPFRALVASIVVAQYERCICEEPEPRLAGRNDLFMAVYLPYVDEFLSNDHGQQSALRQAASIAGIPTSVRWYKEFAAHFSCGLAPST
jgi:hypothetical protein